MSARVTAGLLLAILLLAPLPLGSNRPFFVALLAALTGTALISWGWSGRLALGFRAFAPIVACFSTVWLWCAASLLWSVDRATSLTGLMLLTTCFSLFALTLQVARREPLAREILHALAAASAFYALYGLCVYALGNDHILWFEKWAYADSLTATFVNRNAFAAYAGMGLLASLCVLAHTLAHEGSSLRRGSPRLWLSASAVVALTLAIILTNSRAGIVSIGLGLAALWFGLFFSRLLPRRTLLGLAFAGITLALGSLALAGDRLLQRSEQASFLKDDRPQIWLATLQMIRDRPLTGSGPATYEQMFLQYRTPAIKQSYTKAHSTYLEMAATTGIPCAVIFFTGFGLIGLFLLRGMHIRRQNRIYPAFAFAVLVQAGAHALVDFSFQTPANAAILAIVLGTGMAQSFSSQQA